MATNTGFSKMKPIEQWLLQFRQLLCEVDGNEKKPIVKTNSFS